MKKIFTFWLCILCFTLVQGKDMPLLRFKISRPYCVFNFLETCKGVYGTSESLKQFIEANTANDPSFKKLIDEYINLNIETLFQREGFPDTRPAYRSIKDLLIIAAVQTDNMAEFKQRIPGILHNTDYMRLINLMEKADVFYEKIIWAKHGKAALRQLNNLKKYEHSANEAFLMFKKFYNSTWADDMPFTVALSPVPGKDGSTAATPHANSLCIDVLTEETNYAGRVAITLHEICHVLYAEQSRQVQYDLESCFANSTSRYANAAHNFFDEGLATANGNGWAYQFLTGKTDTGGWYSNLYIDGFGHALFPLVGRYLKERKSIDSAFVDEAIRLFGETFPHSPEDFGIQFNHLTMYADEEQTLERNQIKQDLYEQFNVSWLNFSTPILGAESLTFLKESGGTQFIILDRNYENALTALKGVLPDLNNIPYNPDENFVINYFDTAKRLIIIAKINKGETAHLFKTLKKRQFMNPKEVCWRL